MVLIAKEDESLYAPVVVDEVGIVEVHAPALHLGWETAQEEHTTILWQKGVQRMVFYPIGRTGNILKVEEGGRESKWLIHLREDLGFIRVIEVIRNLRNLRKSERNYKSRWR
jgi:hypothetical protein